jgi:hypothetical protein
MIYHWPIIQYVKDASLLQEAIRGIDRMIVGGYAFPLNYAAARWLELKGYVRSLGYSSWKHQGYEVTDAGRVFHAQHSIPAEW